MNKENKKEIKTEQNEMQTHINAEGEGTTECIRSRFDSYWYD